MVQPKHGIEFSDIGTIFRIVQDWVLKVGIRAVFGSGTAENAGIFCCELFFGKVFEPSFRTT